MCLNKFLFLFISTGSFTITHAQQTGFGIRDTLTLTIQGVTKGSPVTLTHKGKTVDSTSTIETTGGKLVLNIKSNNKPVRIIWQRINPVDRKDFKITKDTSIELDISPGSSTTKNDFTMVVFNTARQAETLKTYDRLTINVKQQEVSEPEGPGKVSDVNRQRVGEGRAPFVDSSMMAAVSGNGSCMSCNFKAIIDRKRERQFSTDYFILYDRSHKIDAYTICKHIFRDTLNKKLVERYRKIRPAYFSPMVGSQVSFEVINFSLLERLSILTDSGDLFLNNASFQSVLTARLNATILSTGAGAPSGKTKAPTEDSAKAQSAKIETDSARVIRLYGELATYVRTFSGSSCTINQHKINSILILNRIQEQFDLEGPMGLVTRQLSNKFKGTSQQQMADDVGAILAALDSLKPLVYATPRLGNRDFVNIKVVNSENQIIANQNIRSSFGLKIDFSSGLFLTGLRDYNYIFKDTAMQYRPADTTLPMKDTVGRIIVREKGDKLNLGFGFLAHVYPRLSSNYNIGLTTGFMATTNLDLNILLGGSVLFQSLFGANTRVAFTGGIAWGKVSRLSNSVHEGLAYENDKPVFYPTSISTPPVVKVWDKSWFFGVTYNF